MDTSTTGLDDLDRDLIRALRTYPRASVSELAKRTGVARGTVYSRIDRLESTGVITGHGPDVDATAAGFGVLGFCTLEIAQGTHEETTDALAQISEIVEIHTVTGPGDLLVRIIARSNDHLHDVLQEIAALPTVGRSQTQLALSSIAPRTVAELVSG